MTTNIIHNYFIQFRLNVIWSFAQCTSEKYWDKIPWASGGVLKGVNFVTITCIIMWASQGPMGLLFLSPSRLFLSLSRVHFFALSLSRSIFVALSFCRYLVYMCRSLAILVSPRLSENEMSEISHYSINIII